MASLGTVKYPNSMSLFYHSTRGGAEALDLRGVTLAGLAPDGGLYVPQTWPAFSIDDQSAFKGASYVDVAQKILQPFVASLPLREDLHAMLQKAYAVFDNPAVTPLTQLDNRHWILELFHGPTLAFKDIALQLLGHFFEYFMTLDPARVRGTESGALLGFGGQRLTVIGATSGDTGSAAIAALAGRKNIDIFILYPENGPSDIQRKQMTCVEASNVHAIALEGSFDDCQAIVKALFSDPVFG